MWIIFLHLILFLMLSNMYYLDTNFYRYFIGSDDQSVNETVMIRRIDQQLRVNKLMVNSYTSCGNMNKRTRAYMISYLDIITTVSSIMLIRSGTKEGLDKKKELLEYIRSTNRVLIRKTPSQPDGELYEPSWKRRKKGFRGGLQAVPEVLRI